MFELQIKGLITAILKSNILNLVIALMNSYFTKKKVLGFIFFQFLAFGLFNWMTFQPDQTFSESSLFLLTPPPVKNSSRIRKPFHHHIFPNPLPFDKIQTPPEIPRDTYLMALEVSCILHGADHLNIIIQDAYHKQYEIPYEDPYPYPHNSQYLDLGESNFEVEVTYHPFDIVIKRKATQETIFKLTDRLVFTQFYIEFSFITPTKEIYGFGARLTPFQIKPGTYSLFLLDRAGEIDPGKPGFNGQGHHPMYLNKEKSGKYHTFLLRNINFQEVTIGNDRKIKWQLTGGVIDLNFFLGEDPESAVTKYHHYLGGWILPAFWHLGYHQNKWDGYTNAGKLKYVLENFAEKKIPLESLWTDAQHMDGFVNFSIDKERYPLIEVKALYEKYKKRWIPLINAHISERMIPPVSEYPNLQSLYMTDSLGETCKGRFLWGEVYFLDFLDPKVGDFWGQMLDDMDSKWALSGVWLDANEVSNLEAKNKAYMWLARKRKYFEFPFYPGTNNFYELPIINLDCRHYNGDEEYNVRPLNAVFQSKYSFDYLKKKFPFPFVLTRATLFGGSKFAFTWIPDVKSSYESMKISLADVLNHNIFGYAMTGADICGFVSDQQVQPELCARWHQLSVFYPFARNSHIPSPENNYQEPYTYKGDYFQTILSSIRLRYSLLKHLYTLFFLKREGEYGYGTILRPLFFDYHNQTDLPCHGSQVHEEQVLLGESIMVAPVLDANVSTLDVYFPSRVRWFDLRTFQEVVVQQGESVSANYSEPIPYFLKGGSILFKQEVDENVLSTEDLGNIFTVVIAFGKGDENAEGYILGSSNYEEQYIYDHCVLKNCLLKLKATYETLKDKINLKLEAASQSTDSIKINEVYIMGIMGIQSSKKKALEIKLDNPTLKTSQEFLENGTIHLKFPEEELVIANNIIHNFVFL